MIGTDSYHISIELIPPEDTPDHPDYRYSPIEITSVPVPASMDTQAIEPIKAKSLGNGVIHLYREFEDDASKSTPQSTSSGDDTMVAILAVPTYFTATDLLGFIGENNMKNVSHLRILKSEKPNRFLVLIKFRDIINAAEFQFQYDGKPFNSMEPEACHVVYVKSVEYSEQPLQDLSNPLLPFLVQDPFTSPMVSNKLNSNKLIELPTCPVCLERMDAEITGLLTIPCQHTFHCQCLSKWRDDSCPICRYSNNFSNQQVRRSVRRLSSFSMHRRPSLAPPVSSPAPTASTSITSLSEVPDSTESCMDCRVNTGLWICLVCGNIGCGRYAPDQHSLKHFVNTGHCFAMEIDTSRVWDYAGDTYVHRLITNESDGKLVELPEKSSSSEKHSSEDKVDEVGFEYSQLLISQLASQREYYESLLQEREASKSKIISNQQSYGDLEKKVENLTSQLAELTTSTIPMLKSKSSLKDIKLEKLSAELNQANSLTEALSKKVEFLEESNANLKDELKLVNEEKQGLEEQVRDLMFFLDSQEKFKDQPQDVKDGTVLVQQAPSKRSQKKKKK